jgi:hypothetical protein
MKPVKIQKCWCFNHHLVTLHKRSFEKREIQVELNRGLLVLDNKDANLTLTQFMLSKAELPCCFDKLHFSKHECASAIDKYIKSGHMKKCAFLKNKPCFTKNRLNDVDTWYRPVCNEQSFEKLVNESMQELCNGCPKDCMCYRSYRKEQINSVIKWLCQSLSCKLKGVVNWFKSLAGITQIFILLIVLFICRADTLIKLLISVVKKA